MASPEDDDNDDTSTRLDAELSLLDAMYPSSVTYSPRSREVRFKASSGELQLRLPDTYPRHGLPSVISACDGARNDLRERLRGAMLELALVQGEECLDRVVGAFEAVLVRVPLVSLCYCISGFILRSVRCLLIEMLITIELQMEIYDKSYLILKSMVAGG